MTLGPVHPDGNAKGVEACFGFSRESAVRRIFRFVLVVIAAAMAALALYGGKGWYDARRQGDELAQRAGQLIAQGRGGEDLGPGHLAVLVQVQDPGFYSHAGVDLETPGAGLTTISQSLAKRLAFEEFKPGIGKIRQTGYAIGLDQELTKQEQLALFLDTVEMGEINGEWVTGFFKASDAAFGTPPSGLDDRQFNQLVAVLIAPGRLKLQEPDALLEERVLRIGNLAAGRCKPENLSDVWLDGCRSDPK
tara:strand:- start:20 stop:766 length:747 start_codon:yes stop_codon:yes gene_type:complete